MSTVIKVENLCKRYYLSHKARERFPTFRDAITRTASNMGKRLLHPLRASSGLPLEGLDSTEEFWALDDVSFEVKQGDRVGIIGRNGAGKSTLLKILSRITEPTKGRVSIKGRVASLLEVGTGFHPELTGRENIFLNGAILGMPRVDIKRKFDEIVAFAEVERFLDTPVKRYSSGMYVRLAFAVAAHLEPEIFVVDEVLAVGDVAFQKKCLGKMDEVGREGRTVLFVSHNMQAIRALCDRGVLLSDGQLKKDSGVDEAIAGYNNQVKAFEFSADAEINNEKFRRGSGAVRFSGIEVKDEKGQIRQSFIMGERVFFHLSFRVHRPVEGLLVSVALRAGMAQDIVTSARHEYSRATLTEGFEGKIVIEWPSDILRPKEYPLYFWLGGLDWQPFDVVDSIVLPLTITTDKDPECLGYQLSDVPGFFNVESKVHRA